MATPETAPLRPDYGGAWTGGVLRALLDGGGPSWLPAVAREARTVVLLVLDGLGWHAVERWPERLPVLGELEGQAIPTSVPSTTSTALTSISTGLSPSEHGILGYRMRVGGEILNVLQWAAGSDEGPAPEDVQPHQPFGGHGLRLVTRSEFRGTGFTRAHLRGGTLVGWRTTAVLVEHVRRLVAGGERVVYAYYDGVDKVAHEYGLDNGFFDVELAFADRLVADLLAALPSDAALVVTGDHGQVHVEDDAKLGLDGVAPMVSAYGGEARFRGLHARRGAAGDLLAACRDLYGNLAWVFPRDELFDDGWFGEGGSALVRGRVGDVVLAARAPVAFIAPDHEGESTLVGYHGSLTADEMLVPLVAGRGRG